VWNFVSDIKEKTQLRMFETRVLRRIFGAKRNEIGGWKKLHNEELHNLYCSPHINMTRMIKSRRMRCSMHGGEEECV
jgi:hypothetical protein